MKTAYFIDLVHPGHYPFCKELERRGYEICELYLHNSDLQKRSKRLKILNDQKYLDDKEFKNHEVNYLSFQPKIKNYFSKFKKVYLNDLKLKPEDKVFSFYETSLVESAMISNDFLTPRQALSFISKHIYYKKLKIFFEKVYNQEDLKNVKQDQFILKPSVCSTGQMNIFKINSFEDRLKIIKENPNIFTGKKLFIAMPIIKYVDQIWAFSLFDSNGNPYPIWYLTEQGHSTKSPFDKDILIKLIEINKSLKIKNWMACVQFLLDEYGNLHFIDLNARIPGDDDWYELFYKYLTGKRLSKIILDLILDHKKPEIIQTNKYIYEEEFNKNKEHVYKNIKNIKIWPYTDFYKKKPVLFFKKHQ